MTIQPRRRWSRDTRKDTVNRWASATRIVVAIATSLAVIECGDSPVSLSPPAAPSPPVGPSPQPTLLYNTFGAGNSYELPFAYGIDGNTGLVLFHFVASSSGALDNITVAIGRTAATVTQTRFALYDGTITAHGSLLEDFIVPNNVATPGVTRATWGGQVVTFNSIIRPTLTAGQDYWLGFNELTPPDGANSLWFFNDQGIHGSVRPVTFPNWNGSLPAFRVAGSSTGPSGPPPPPAAANIDGTYALRFDSTCAALPSELRSRTYTASIVGSPNVVVTLTGANFWTHPADGLLNRFTGRVTGSSVSFSVFWPPNTERWGIVEEIDSTGYFEILGRGSGSISDSTIEGRLSAGVGFGTDLRDDARHVGCSATGHDLTFRFNR